MQSPDENAPPPLQGTFLLDPDIGMVENAGGLGFRIYGLQAYLSGAYSRAPVAYSRVPGPYRRVTSG